jgi:hypothetical protein
MPNCSLKWCAACLHGDAIDDIEFASEVLVECVAQARGIWSGLEGELMIAALKPQVMANDFLVGGKERCTKSSVRIGGNDHLANGRFETVDSKSKILRHVVQSPPWPLD